MGPRNLKVVIRFTIYINVEEGIVFDVSRI